MDQQPVLDFIEFSLIPFLSHKDIQLVQLKINQSKPSNAKKKTDLFYLQCFYFKKAIDLVRKHKKHTSLLPQSSEFSLYASLTKLDPEEILLLLSDARYHISDEVVSTVLNKPIDSLVFRRNQIIDAFSRDGLKSEFEKIKTIQLSKLNDELQIYPRLGSVPGISMKLSKLNRIPAPVRFVFEMTAVLVLLFFIMWLVPEIRNTYENSIQKRINEYLIDSSLTDSPAPAGFIKPKIIEQPTEMTETSAQKNEENNSIDKESAPRKQPKVSDGETWRFSFTGQGQTDLESEITAVLQKRTKDKEKRLVVPGGIQYDFFIKTSELISLKIELEALTTSLQKVGNKTAMVNLSWYKKRIVSSHKIPPGNVLVIIWVSTL